MSNAQPAARKRRMKGGILLWVIVAILLAVALGSIRVGGHPIIPAPAVSPGRELGTAVGQS